MRVMVAMIIFSAVLFGATLVIYSERILLGIGDFLVVEDKLEPADVIHVIAGPDYRTEYGIQLYKQGYGRQVFFTGGWCSLHNENHGQRGKERAVQQGVPSEAISLNDSKVTSTYSEVVRLREFIAQSQVPIKSVIVVSDPHHMRRARWTYRQVLDHQISIQMAPVPFALSPYRNRWWTDGESRIMVRDEYLKFLYYIARYELSRGGVKEWLASFDRD
jgi:uncharacterized SAM-binding protein YcdF (DUF218 family)